MAKTTRRGCDLLLDEAPVAVAATETGVVADAGRSTAALISCWTINRTESSDEGTVLAAAGGPAVPITGVGAADTGGSWSGDAMTETKEGEPLRQNFQNNQSHLGRTFRATWGVLSEPRLCCCQNGPRG